MDSELKRRLEDMSGSLGLDLTSREFAVAMDAKDPVRHLRSQFHYPKMKDLPLVDLAQVDPEEDSIYFCGNSLGLCPVGTKEIICNDLEKWSKYGVYGHTKGFLPWAEADLCVDEQMASIVGAKREEVAVMNGLSVNLHLLMLSFYKPTANRHKILCENKPFPSDHYMMESQIKLKGFDPATSILCAKPKSGEECIEDAEILRLIEEEGDSIAVLLIGGVQYYTGQLFDMAAITEAAHKKGIYVGFDLAHAVGNVPLKLHEWGVDFACWCTYKYLNSGAGNIAGAFIHEKHNGTILPALTGWWGHKHHTRFVMDNEMDLESGARGFRLTNPSGLMSAAVMGSLNVYSQTSVEELRKKSIMLTGYLEWMIRHYFSSDSPGSASHSTIRIFTPSNPERRGCQLSLCFSIPISTIFKRLTEHGVVCDERMPSVIRIAPVHIYNSFEDVYRFIQTLRKVIQEA